MPAINRVLLTGRATRDPELRYLASGVPVVRLPLEFDRWSKTSQGTWERHPNYLTAVVTGPTALRTHQELKRGGKLYLEGQLQTHHWTAPGGVTRNSLEIKVDRLQILDGGQESLVQESLEEGPPEE